jgi:uncharacterized membrane protein YdjX (TVP38/TMEM64 family)
MKELLRSLPLVVAVLLVPIVPFLIFGGRLDHWFKHWSETATDPVTTSAVVIGVLSSDIFLPIPSSMVSTLAGSQLGWLIGTLASWLGMSIGAFAGFALARWIGPTFTRWFTKEQSLTQMRRLSERFGPSVIVLTRGLPILAEASVLLMGLERMTWRRFLPPLLLANLGLSLVYAVFGDFARQYDSFPFAIAVSVLLPLLVAAIVQRWLPRDETDAKE